MPGSAATAVVAYGRQLLVAALRVGLQRGLVKHNEEGFFANAIGEREIERIAQEIEQGAATVAHGRPPRPHDIGPLRDLLAGLGVPDVAEALVTLLVTVELDAPSRAIATYLRGSS